MDKLKFSILGYGHIGKVHEQAILQTPNVELLSIIDLDLESHSKIKTYNTLESFLQEDQETNIVTVATPNGLHRDHAIRCLKAGKHVLIEKPIALTLEDANEILLVAEQKGLRVFSSMQLRFSPPVNYVKKLLTNQCLGQVYMINTQCYWNRNKNYYKQREWHGKEAMDGGVLFTQFSHFVDILNFWFDDLKILNSKYYNFNHKDITEFPDSGKIDFIADEHTHGNMIFTTSTFQKNFESNITIIAEKGTIKIGSQYLNQLLYSDLKNIICSQNLTTDTKNFHPKVIEEVAQALVEDKSSILDGSHAVRLVEFIENTNQLAKVV